jgi:hypothetical protein
MLVTHHSLHLGVLARLFTPKVLRVRERILTPSVVFTFRFAFESYEEFGGASTFDGCTFPFMALHKTLPLLVFFVPGHGGYTQMSFCPGTPKLEVLKFSKLGLLQLWRPIIFCTHLRLGQCLKQSFSLVKNFPTVCDMSPAHK